MYYQKISILKAVIVAVIAVSSVTTSAKSPELTKKELSVPPPRIIRTCCGFGVEIGFVAVPFARKTDITSVEIMGTHQFLGHRNEKNGIVYTRRGGFLDLGHLRDCADWTAYLYDLIKSSQTDPSLSKIDLRKYTLHSLKPFSFINIDFEKDIKINGDKKVFDKTNI